MSGDGRDGTGRTDLLVLGGGPGGYTAAFRAADLGLSVTLVERHSRLGGVCLNVGCIPSKTLLHAAKLITDAEHARDLGIGLGEPRVDLDALRAATASVVDRLVKGLSGLAKQRRVRVVHGEGRFSGPDTLTVEGEGGAEEIRFAQCVVAAGSEPIRLPGIPDDPRVMDSTGALALPDVPERLLVIGGGIIGLEMATVYDALGSRVTVVEMMDQLIPGCDTDLVQPLHRRMQKRWEAIHLGTRVAGIEAADDGLHATFDGGDREVPPAVFDRVLVAVGRRSNGDRLGLRAAGVSVDERTGVVPVDERMRTDVPHIFAIGDLTGNPMLAHKASRQGVVAAEVAAGHDSVFDPRTIPAVAYTDPEVAWAGVTQTQARAEGIEIEVHTIPWAASGRALTMGRAEGRTILITEPGSGRVIGAGIVGVNADDLLAEAVLAIEMGATAEDVALTIHSHPTLSETVAFAAEAAEGTITDLYLGARGGRPTA